MKTATDLPAVITVHEATPGLYVLRISELKWRPLLVSVAKLLEDARLLVVITPSDIKVLRVSGSANEAREAPVANLPGNAEEAADPEPVDDETLALIKEQETHALPSTPVEEAAVPAEQGMRVVRRPKPNGRAGHAEVCGRCRGEGHVRIIEEGGAAGQAPCGVCQGSGQITRYGARR